MAYDKVVDSTVLDGYFSDIADAIRDQGGTSATLTPAQMPQAIEDLPIDDGMIDAIMENDGPRHDKRYEYTNNNVTTIHVSPFSGYDGSHLNEALTRVELRALTEITPGAFTYCRALSEVIMPALEKVPAYCFRNCSGLTTLDVSNATELGNYALGYSGLTSFVSDKMEKVAGNAFNQSQVETIKLGSIVASNGIQGSAFYMAQKLVTADLKAKDANFSIASQAFSNCTLLTALILRDTTMDTLAATNAFTKTPIASGTGYIYVPRDLVATYQAATNWATYSAQFRALEDYTVDGTIDGDLDPTKI